jgi:hypothetical protein
MSGRLVVSLLPAFYDQRFVKRDAEQPSLARFRTGLVPPLDCFDKCRLQHVVCQVPIPQHSHDKAAELSAMLQVQCSNLGGAENRLLLPRFPLRGRGLTIALHGTPAASDHLEDSMRAGGVLFLENYWIGE